MSEERPEFDFAEAQARLERMRRALEAGAEPGAEEVERILRARARSLARPAEEAPKPAETLELLVFALGGERYAVEAAHVLGVARLRELTALPCTPGFLLGVVSQRGRTLPVLDLRAFLGQAGQAVSETSLVVAVEAGGMSLAILAEAVQGTLSVGTEEMARGAGPAAKDTALVRGVTADMIAVLDLDALAHDPRLVVNEEVG